MVEIQFQVPIRRPVLVLVGRISSLRRQRAGDSIEQREGRCPENLIEPPLVGQFEAKEMRVSLTRTCELVGQSSARFQRHEAPLELNRSHDPSAVARYRRRRRGRRHARRVGRYGDLPGADQLRPPFSPFLDGQLASVLAGVHLDLLVDYRLRRPAVARGGRAAGLDALDYNVHVALGLDVGGYQLQSQPVSRRSFSRRVGRSRGVADDRALDGVGNEPSGVHRADGPSVRDDEDGIAGRADPRQAFPGNREVGLQELDEAVDCTPFVLVEQGATSQGGEAEMLDDLAGERRREASQYFVFVDVLDTTVRIGIEVQDAFLERFVDIRGFHVQLAALDPPAVGPRLAIFVGDYGCQDGRQTCVANDSPDGHRDLGGRLGESCVES